MLLWAVGIAFSARWVTTGGIGRLSGTKGNCDFLVVRSFGDLGANLPEQQRESLHASLFLLVTSTSFPVRQERAEITHRLRRILAA